MARKRTRVIDIDPYTGIKTLWHDDVVGESAYIEEVQDVEAILDANRAAYNQVDERARFGDKFNQYTHVARIPAVIVNQMMREGVWGDPQAMKKWLNDRDNAAFRTRPGNV